MKIEYNCPMISISKSDFDKSLIDAKIEAIKELADRLQNRCDTQQGCIHSSDIGAELDKMIGEQK